jgi:hypothetical protein
MKIETQAKVGGVMTLNILRRGKLIPVCENVKNLVLHSGMGDLGIPKSVAGATVTTFTSTSPNHEDVAGTWNQSGNTVTRATGAGVVGASPSPLANEIKWNTGERAHITARASDTSFTVSGPARTITGGTFRRYFTTASASAQQSGKGLVSVPIFLLVPQAQLKKKIDINSAVQRWESQLIQNVISNWPDE